MAKYTYVRTDLGDAVIEWRIALFRGVEIGRTTDMRLTMEMIQAHAKIHGLPPRTLQGATDSTYTLETYRVQLVDVSLAEIERPDWRLR